jgi:hypothetical protein
LRGLLDDVFPDRKRRGKSILKITNPEKTQDEPISTKISDYWSSSSTGNNNYKYEN